MKRARRCAIRDRSSLAFRPLVISRKLLTEASWQTIELCAEVFNLAHFRRTKGAVELHLMLDHDGLMPCYAVITEVKKHKRWPRPPWGLSRHQEGSRDRGSGREHSAAQADDDSRPVSRHRLAIRRRNRIEGDRLSCS
jgi:hypothetical protein